MGIIETGIKIGGGLVLGFMLGKGCSGDTVTQYVQGMQLREGGEDVQLYHATQDETYKIKVIDDKVFLGDAAHNAEGFKKLTIEELKQQYIGD